MAPPPDPNVGADIQQADQQSADAEKDVTAEAGSDGGGNAASAAPAAPPSVELGQTPNQVQAAMGAPTRVANLGPKVIYYYNGMKITFMNGKVSDVQ